MTARVGRNIFSLALSRILSGVVLFFVLAKVAAYLGPDGFGKFSLVLAYYTIFFLFVDLGISRYVIKKVSEDKSVAPVYLGNFFMAQVLLSLIIFLIFVFIPKIFSYDLEVTLAMRYAGIGLLLSAISIPFATIVQAWQRVDLLASVYFVDSIIRAGWAIAAIALGKGITFIYAAYIVTGIVDVIAYSWTTRSFTRPQFKFDKSLAKRLFLFGIPFAFISGFEIIISKIDVIIQKFFLPFSEVGIYAAPYRILDFLTFLHAVVAISLFPVFSESINLKTPEITHLTERINRFMVAVAIPLGFFSTFYAEKIILTIFGNDYQGSIFPFQILIWSTVITLLYAVPNVVMQVKQTRRAIIILAGAAALNAALNWIFVPIYGIVASAWLTVATYFLVAILYIFYSLKLAEVRILRLTLWPLFASTIAAVLLWPFRNLNIFIIIVIALILYFGTLIFVRFFRREDLNEIIHINR